MPNKLDVVTIQDAIKQNESENIVLNFSVHAPLIEIYLFENLIKTDLMVPEITILVLLRIIKYKVN